MATAILHPMFTAIRGRLGDKVFKTYRDKIVVTRVPCFDGYVPTAAQRARRERMREATAFAKRAYADPAAKAFYMAAAQKLGRQPFRLAISDHLTGHARMQAVSVLAPPAPVDQIRVRPTLRPPNQPNRRGGGFRNQAGTARRIAVLQRRDERPARASQINPARRTLLRGSLKLYSSSPEAPTASQVPLKFQFRASGFGAS